MQQSSEWNKKNKWLCTECGCINSTTKKEVNKIEYEIKIKLVKGHPKRVGTKRENPIAHLMKQFDKVAIKAREQSKMTNVKCHGCCSMKIVKKGPIKIDEINDTNNRCREFRRELRKSKIWT